MQVFVLVWNNNKMDLRAHRDPVAWVEGIEPKLMVSLTKSVLSLNLYLDQVHINLDHLASHVHLKNCSD